MRHILLSIAFNFCLIATSSAFTVGSYNIKMYDARPGTTNKTELVKILTRINYDFLTVQEIVNTSSLRKLIATNFDKYSVVTTQCGGAGRQQIAFIYDKRKFKLKRAYDDNRISNPFITDPRERCPSLRPVLVGIFTEISTGQEFVMMGVHLKAGGHASSYRKRKIQYNELRKIIAEFKNRKQNNIILMGDFNTTGYNLRDSDYQNFNNLLTRSDMISTSEQISCSAYWTGPNTRDNIEESSVLDHVLLPKSFLGKSQSTTRVGTHCAKVACARVSAKELGLSYKEVSDHCPLITTLY